MDGSPPLTISKSVDEEYSYPQVILFRNCRAKPTIGARGLRVRWLG